MKAFTLTVVAALVVVGFCFWWDHTAADTESLATSSGGTSESSAVASTTAAAPGFSHADSESNKVPDASDVPTAPVLIIPPSARPAPTMPTPGAATPPSLTPGDVEVTPEQIAADLDSLSLGLRDYRTLMAQNPVGTNSEITEALMGGNRKSARLAPPDVRLNGKGELVDRWGVPYFFHQLSATAMEIHSAGPDKKMGTDDDIIHR